MNGIYRQKDSFLQSRIMDIPEGMVVYLRPVILSENQNILEVTTSIYQSKGDRPVLYPLDRDLLITSKIPELSIQKGHASIPMEKNKFYILSGFQYGEMAPSKELLFLVIPTVMKSTSETIPAEIK
jgi:hypothetical protein